MIIRDFIEGENGNKIPLSTGGLAAENTFTTLQKFILYQMNKRDLTHQIKNETMRQTSKNAFEM